MSGTEENIKCNWDRCTGRLIQPLEVFSGTLTFLILQNFSLNGQCWIWGGVRSFIPSPSNLNTSNVPKTVSISAFYNSMILVSPFPVPGRDLTPLPPVLFGLSTCVQLGIGNSYYTKTFNTGLYEKQFKTEIILYYFAACS